MDIIVDMVTGLVLAVVNKGEEPDWKKLREDGPVHEYGSDYEKTSDFS